MADIDEGSRGGRRSIMLFGGVAAALLVFLVVVGSQAPKHAEPSTPQSNTELPAPAGSQNP
jgi:hypothetical protein